VDHVVDAEMDGEAVGLVGAAEDLWMACRDELRPQVSDASWMTWFASVEPITLEERELVLAVPNAVVKERLESRFLPTLREAVTRIEGRPLDVELVVHSHDQALTVTPPPSTAPSTEAAPRNHSPDTATRSENHDMVIDVREAGPPASSGSPLNPRYTFEAFVTGQSNRFAHAAALSVAETPSRSYNPLFIYGGAGLGKTHLLHAIGHYINQNYPDRHVRYVSTETFTNDFIDSIRTNTASAFKRHYRECDVLLVDDIQFLENKEGTQEEFFHTFNSLHGANRQIVMTSDRPPKSIATLEDRLRSRFEWGLITDVTPPDLETRIAILRRKAEADKFHPPDEVLEFIATHITDNIRELEGALIRVTAFASLNREAITQVLAEKVLADVLSANEGRQVTPALILETTATTFGFSIDELCGRSRRRPLVIARQIGMYVFREMTDFSYPAIAREFGGRDHTTVIHAVEKIATQMKERRMIYDQVTELIHRIKNGG
jgi:chromosomal replication initiator protein